MMMKRGRLGRWNISGWDRDPVARREAHALNACDFKFVFHLQHNLLYYNKQ